MSRTLVLLTRHPYLYTSRRIQEECRDRGWIVRIHLPSKRFRGATAESNALTADSVTMDSVVWARPGPFTLIEILGSHREQTRLGTRPLQSRHDLLVACDQWRTLQALRKAGLPVPESMLIREPRGLDRALKKIAGPPWFIKARRGSQGSHVLLASNPHQARRMIRFLWGLGLSAILQQDLRERGSVRRHLIVSGRVLVSALAIAADGEYRSNWHRGGRWRIEANPAGQEIALRAAKAVGLPCQAIDTIGDRSVAVLEVNASPGLEGLEQSTGRNLVGEMVDALLETNTRTRTAPA